MYKAYFLPRLWQMNPVSSEKNEIWEIFQLIFGVLLEVEESVMLCVFFPSPIPIWGPFVIFR